MAASSTHESERDVASSYAKGVAGKKILVLFRYPLRSKGTATYRAFHARVSFRRRCHFPIQRRCLRPRRIFATPPTTARCANMRSAGAELRCPTRDSGLRRRRRSASHDRVIHGCAQTEPGPLPLRSRLPPFVNRTITPELAMTSLMASRRLSAHACRAHRSSARVARPVIPDLRRRTFRGNSR